MPGSSSSGSPEPLPAPGRPVPNWRIEDPQGVLHSIWSYRQHSHLALICEPEAGPEASARWRQAIDLDRRQWEWLNVTWLVAARLPEGAMPGVYLIDRFGRLLAYFPPRTWSFDAIEREFLYYEAQHC